MTRKRTILTRQDFNLLVAQASLRGVVVPRRGVFLSTYIEVSLDSRGHLDSQSDPRPRGGTS